VNHGFFATSFFDQMVFLQVLFIFSALSHRNVSEVRAVRMVSEIIGDPDEGKASVISTLSPAGKKLGGVFSNVATMVKVSKIFKEKRQIAKEGFPIAKDIAQSHMAAMDDVLKRCQAKDDKTKCGNYMPEDKWLDIQSFDKALQHSAAVCAANGTETAVGQLWKTAYHALVEDRDPKLVQASKKLSLQSQQFSQSIIELRREGLCPELVTYVNQSVQQCDAAAELYHKTYDQSWYKKKGEEDLVAIISIEGIDQSVTYDSYLEENCFKQKGGSEGEQECNAAAANAEQLELCIDNCWVRAGAKLRELHKMCPSEERELDKQVDQRIRCVPHLHKAMQQFDRQDFWSKLLGLEAKVKQYLGPLGSWVDAAKHYHYLYSDMAKIATVATGVMSGGISVAFLGGVAKLSGAIVDAEIDLEQACIDVASEFPDIGDTDEQSLSDVEPHVGGDDGWGWMPEITQDQIQGYL